MVVMLTRRVRRTLGCSWSWGRVGTLWGMRRGVAASGTGGDIMEGGRRRFGDIGGKNKNLKEVRRMVGEDLYGSRDGSVRPENRLVFYLDPEYIRKLAGEIIQHCKEVEDRVAGIQDGTHTFDNTILPLAQLEGDISALVSSCDFMHHVHPDAEIREASNDADMQLSSYFVESGMREDVYIAVVKCKQALEESGKWESELDEEDRRVVEFILRDYRRNGLHLGKEERDSLEKIQQEMSKLDIAFARNLAEDESKCVFEEEDLEGMSKDFISKLARTEDGKVIVTMKYPDVYPILKLAKREETRKVVENTFASICMTENSKILERLVELRYQQSQILGFPNHNAYVLDVRMAKSPETVREFLEDLSSRLDPLFEKELAILLDLKRQDKESAGLPYDGRIHMWDFRFYMNLREEKEFQVDHEKIKEYFPLQKVTQGLLEIYQELLDLRFSELKDFKTWHPDVRLFDVHDRSSGEFIGQFYLDLHPRPGKYGHAACFGLQPSFGFGSNVRGGSKQYPIAAMVANFTKPGADKPSLLEHQEVVTYFHEFGHVVHCVNTFEVFCFCFSKAFNFFLYFSFVLKLNMQDSLGLALSETLSRRRVKCWRIGAGKKIRFYVCQVIMSVKTRLCRGRFWTNCCLPKMRMLACLTSVKYFLLSSIRQSILCLNVTVSRSIIAF